MKLNCKGKMQRKYILPARFCGAFLPEFCIGLAAFGNIADVFIYVFHTYLLSVCRTDVQSTMEGGIIVAGAHGQGDNREEAGQGQ